MTSINIGKDLVMTFIIITSVVIGLIWSDILHKRSTLKSHIIKLISLHVVIIILSTIHNNI